MRSRVLKPGFFSDEGLAKLSLEAQFVFSGLWCIADRDGRLLDIPKKIDAEIFPHREFGVRKMDGWLRELHDAGFIHRYETEGKKCIQVANFAKHQKVHPRENPSTIPPRHGNTQGDANGSTLGMPQGSTLGDTQAAPTSVPLTSVPLTSVPLTSVPPACRAQGSPSATPSAEECAQRMIARHPNRARAGNPASVGRVLSQVIADSVDVEADLKRIEANHAGWSKSENWTKQGAEFCPKLQNWIIDRECFTPPPAKPDPYAHYKDITPRKDTAS